MTRLTDSLDWPDVEDVTTAYLEAALTTSAAVGAFVPRPVTGPHVRVQRTGGALDSDGVFDAARLTLECRATTKEAAHDLALTCRDLMRRIPGARSGWHVTRSTETGFAYIPDAEPGTPRYLVTHRVTFRAQPHS